MAESTIIAKTRYVWPFQDFYTAFLLWQDCKFGRRRHATRALSLSLSYSVIKSSNRAMAAALSALISSVVWRKVGSLASRGGV